MLRWLPAAWMHLHCRGDQSRSIRSGRALRSTAALNAHWRWQSRGRYQLRGSASSVAYGLRRRIGAAASLCRRPGGAPEWAARWTMDSGASCRLPYCKGAWSPYTTSQAHRWSPDRGFVARAATGQLATRQSSHLASDEDTPWCVEPDRQAQVYSAEAGKVWVVNLARMPDRAVRGRAAALCSARCR